MIRLTVALRRLPSLSRREFQAYWLDKHALLIASLASVLGIESYVQLHSEPRPDPAGGFHDAPFDGLAEVTYAGREAFEARMRTTEAQEAARLIRADELCFIDRKNSPRWWGSIHQII